MHLQDGPDVDLPVQVARAVKDKTRPWGSIISLALAIAAAITSAWAHSSFEAFFRAGHVQYQIIAAASAVAFLVFASIATFGLSRAARRVLEPRIGTAHAAVVKYAVLLIGGFATLAITLALFDVPIGQLLLGGVLTSVIIGIAAQQSLSNIFAGMVLLLARPFRVGDLIWLRGSGLGGELTGTVTDIGITYVRLDTGTSVMSLPNSQVLNAVVGPPPQQASAAPVSPPADDQPAPPG
jgi:small-conductance mechanosensitive channel